MVKGVWTLFASIPAIAFECLTKNPRVVFTYTGGISGTFILFIIAATLIFNFRNKLAKKKTFK
jgi:hypothetical protein